jgi:hypothetical protein
MKFLRWSQPLYSSVRQRCSRARSRSRTAAAGAPAQDTPLRLLSNQASPNPSRGTAAQLRHHLPPARA